jgi:uncharacterized protein involved in exopolysaccharide biosynthesis
MMNGNDTGTTQVSAREILTIIFRRKTPIILVAVVVATAALTAASRTTSVYRATAKVLIRRIGATPLSTTWTPFYGLEEEMNTEVELMTTEVVLERAVEILKEGGVYLYVASGDSQIAREPTVSDIAAGISASPVEMSNIILVRYTGPKRAFVAEAANAVAEAYVEHRVTVRRAGSVDEFFGEQLTQLEGRLMDLKQMELQLRRESEIYDLEWQYRAAINRRSAIQEQLALLTSQRTAEEEKTKLVQERLEEDPDVLVPFAKFSQDRIGGQMLSEYWSLRRERDQHAATFTEENPQVKMLDERIAKMEARFKEEVDRRVKEQQFLLEDLRAEETGFREAVTEISDELRPIPEVVAQIAHLEKEIHYTYMHYDKVLEKMLDLMASEATDARMSNAKVVGRARAELTKAGRMQTIYIAFSMVLGITLGVGFGFLLETMDHSVRSAADVEEILGLTLLGSIPDNRRLPTLTDRVDKTFSGDS